MIHTDLWRLCALGGPDLFAPKSVRQGGGYAFCCYGVRASPRQFPIGNRALHQAQRVRLSPPRGEPDEALDSKSSFLHRNCGFDPLRRQHQNDFKIQNLFSFCSPKAFFTALVRPQRSLSFLSIPKKGNYRQTPDPIHKKEAHYLQVKKEKSNGSRRTLSRL